MENCLGLWMQK